MSTTTLKGTGPSPAHRVTSGRRRSFAALAAGTLLATGVTLAPTLLSFTGASAATVLQGKTFYDLNKNGIQDVTAVLQTNETAIAGIPVTVTATNGTVGTGVSGDNGQWTVTMAADGPYRVEFGALPQRCPANVPAPCVVTGSNAGGTTVQFPGTGQTTVNLGVFAKFNGLGALEALTAGTLVEVGDRVWEDTNANGIQDPGEPGIANVTVKLIDSFTGNPTGGTTTTDANGYYLFTKVQDNLPYTITVDSNDPNLVGYTLTQGGQGNRGIDSNPLGLDAAGIAVAPVPVRAPYENDHTFDFGWTPKLGSLGDYVFLDANADGIQNNGDTAIKNVKVTLLDGNANPVPNVPSQITGDDGKYLFTGLAAGIYKVKFEAPDGLKPTIGGQGDPALDSNIGEDAITNAITLGRGQKDITVDAGFVKPAPPAKATLGNFVFEDRNDNGIQDEDEPGINGVVVILRNAAGAEISRTTTTGNGGYSFPNLDPATYSVQFVKPAGFNSAKANIGTNDNTDSDASTTDGTTRTYTLVAGQNEDSVDAGFVRIVIMAKYNLGDRLFDDLNSNGIQDSNEPGIVGAKVELLDASSNVLATKLTEADGRYTFFDLNQGQYRVRFTAPAGRAFTSRFIGTDRGLDSNVDGNGLSDLINLVATDLTIDAGVITIAPTTVPPATVPPLIVPPNTTPATTVAPTTTVPATVCIGDKVFTDPGSTGGVTAKDGTGIPGVTVTLVRTDGTSVAATTRTDVGGFYKFCGLVPGSYTVKVDITTLPKGATNTYDLDGDRNSETKVILATTNNLDVDFGYITPVVENTVITAAPASAPPTPPLETLSYTGAETTQRGLMGLSMLLIGFGLVGLARNRRRLGVN